MTTPRLLCACWLLLVGGCAESYCQMGPKHGKQCYTINEVEWQETQVRSEPRAPTLAPAPGCVSVGTQGITTQPIPSPATAAGAPTQVRPGVHLMSGACVDRRLPVHGAVR